MTETPVDELEGRELDRAVEREVFDVHRVDHQGVTPGYSGNAEYVRDVESYIKGLGLVDEYIAALLEACCPGATVYDLRYVEIFRLIHATPTERCRASLKAVRTQRAEETR